MGKDLYIYLDEEHSVVHAYLQSQYGPVLQKQVYELIY